MSEPTPESFLPLRPGDFLILLVLADGERHGYGIRADVAALTADEVLLDAGNLYRCLRRLLDSGLVEKAARQTAPDADDERRRYYRLSELGRRVVTAEARRMHGLLLLNRVRDLVGESP